MKRTFLFVVLILLLFNTRLSAQAICALTLTSAPGSETQSICSNSSISPITYFSLDNTGVIVNGLPGGVTSRYSTNGGYGYLLISGTPTSAGTFNYTVAMACDPNVTAASGTITVNPIPDAIASPSSQTICFAGPIAPIILSGAVSGTTFTWARDNAVSIPGIGAVGTGNISGTFTNPANASATITFTITPGANGCTGPPTTATVLVNAKPDAVATPNQQTICSGAPITAIALTGAVSGTTYTWARDNTIVVTGIGDAAAGSFISGTLTSQSNLPETVAFTITPTANGCPGTPITASVLVNPTPDVVAVPTSQTICSGAPLETIQLFGDVIGTSFDWIRGGLTTANVTGMAGIGTGNIVGSLTHTTDIPITVTFTITPIANGCAGPSTTSTVRIDPTPDAVATPASQAVCSGLPVNAIVLTGQVSGTSFNWTRDNAVAVTGMGASGSGSISGTLVNTTNAPATVTFTITPTANGCPGAPITASILVNPTPHALATPASQISCSGIALAAISNSSDVVGTTFTWTRGNTVSVTGIGASGSGGISGVLTNTTNAPETVVFSITPTANACVGTPVTATALVNPTPNAIATPASQTICSGEAISTIVDSGYVGGTSFTWTRNSALTVTGIAASGSGNISGALTNTTSAPITVSFTVMPTANTCPGPSTTATVLVNPTPNALATPASQSLCSGAPINTIALSGNVSSTIFNWTRDNAATVTGILASSSGNIGGTLVNTTNAVLTVTFEIAPVANACPGAPITATVLVYPTPTASATPAVQSRCSGTAIDSIKFSSNVTGMVFNWTRDNGTLSGGPVLGIAGSGQGPITGALTNTTNLPQTVTFTITPIAGGCPGLPFPATVLVYPTPVIDTISDYTFPDGPNYTYCNRESAPGFYFTSSSPDSSFTWTGSENIGFGTNGSGIIPPFVAKNSGSVPLIDTITVSVIGSIRRCLGPSRTFIITVNPSPPTPVFKSLLPHDIRLSLCKGSENIAFNVSDPVDSISYLWSSTPSNVAIKDQNDPNTVISFKEADTFIVKVTASYATSCTDSVTQEVRVRSTAGIEEGRIFLKQPGNVLIYTDNSMNSGEGYEWGYDSLLRISPNRAYSSGKHVPGQVYQFFVPESRFLNSSNALDTIARAFWVQLRKENCYSRVYYNGPYSAGRFALLPPEDNTVRLKVIPNPNNGDFNISLEGNIYGDGRARIYNALGQVVFDAGFTKSVPVISERFNIGHLPGGLYYIEMASSDLKKVQSRFVIQR